MSLLFWTKEAKATRLMTKLETLYHQLSVKPLSSIPEIADLEAEANAIELSKVAHAHYLLRREYPTHTKLPLSPGIVIHCSPASITSPLLPYTSKFAIPANAANFFQRALAQANLVHDSNRLASISAELSYTYTSTEAIALYDALSGTVLSYYYYSGPLSFQELEPFAFHFKLDIFLCK